MITGRRNNVVLISEEDWHAVNQMLHKEAAIKWIPAETLKELTGIISVGGDALADSESIYDLDDDAN